MSEWWTYTLSDFLLFAPQTYWRLLERYNLAIWPAQIAFAAIGIVVAGSLRRNGARRVRLRSGLLAVCWLWVAWTFHATYYAEINWAAPSFAAASALQALVLVAIAIRPGSFALARPTLTSAIIVALTVVAYPLLAPLTGRAWTTVETFGAMPDPTAIATVAVFASAQRRWLALSIPLAWCVIAVATHWAMGTPEAFVVTAATIAALVSDSLRRREPSRGRSSS